MAAVRFFVEGNPAPQGSKRAFVRHGKAIMLDDCKRLHPWRDKVAKIAAGHFEAPSSAPVRMDLVFHLQATKQAIKAGLVGKPCDQKPDIDKLERAVFDALTGIAYDDDKRVAAGSRSKVWSLTPGVDIQVSLTVT